jgi:hypothetical protein
LVADVATVVQPQEFTEPVIAVGFGDAGVEVVADLEQTVPLGGVGPQQGESEAGVFVDAVLA